MAARLAGRARVDRSFRYLTPASVGSVRGVVSLALLVYSAAGRAVVDALHKRERRFLSWFAAIHRTGGCGWRGTELSLEVLAQAVAAATGEAASVGTAKRALGGLLRAGLLSWSWCGVRGKVEIRPGEWVTLQIKRWTLTPAAISLWSRSSGAPKASSGPAPASSPVVCVSSLPGSKCSATLKADSSVTTETKEQPKGSSDRPPVLEAGGGGVACGDGRLEPRNRSAVAVAVSSDVAADTLQRSPRLAVATSENRKPRATSGAALVGVERAAPDRPRRGAPPTWDNGRRALLADLHVFLRAFPRGTASALYARARSETDPGWPATWPAATAWDHWVPRWRSMFRGERFGFLRRSILPGLRAPAGIPASGGPHLPATYPPTPPAAPIVARTVGEVAAWLAARSPAAASGPAGDRFTRSQRGALELAKRAREAEERDRRRLQGLEDD